MLWASISSTWRTPLRGTTRRNWQGKTATRYRDQILTIHLREFWQHVGENFFLVDGNSLSHRAVLVDDFRWNWNYCPFRLVSALIGLKSNWTCLGQPSKASCFAITATHLIWCSHNSSAWIVGATPTKSSRCTCPYYAALLSNLYRC